MIKKKFTEEELKRLAVIVSKMNGNGGRISQLGISFMTDDEIAEYELYFINYMNNFMNKVYECPSIYV